MSNILNKIQRKIFETLLKLPLLGKHRNFIYKQLGIIFYENARIYGDLKVIGNYSNIIIKTNAEITNCCFLLAKDKIIIGDNSTLAYQTTILTSAYPNGPYNKLAIKYPRLEAPVIIGANSWIGAKSMILPGVTIGDFCIVAAGSVVNKDVPNYTVVAGVPAKEVKKLNPEDFK